MGRVFLFLLGLTLSLAAHGANFDGLIKQFGAQVLSNAAAHAAGATSAQNPDLQRDLTEVEWQNARAAESIFTSFQPGTPAGDPSFEIYDPTRPDDARRLIARLRQATVAIAAGTRFTNAQLIEYAEALLPFARYLNAGANATGVVVSPGQKKIFKAQAYCLDRTLPAPVPQDKLRLVPSDKLFPGNRKALYDALMQLSAAQPAGQQRNAIQNLAWGLRHADQGYKPDIDSGTRALLNQAMPDGANAYEGILQEAQRKALEQKSREDLFRQFQQVASSALKIQLPPPSAAAGTFTANDVVATLAQLNRAPAPPPNELAQGSPYTLLQPDVAVKVSNASQAASMQLEIINSSSTPFEFNSLDYAGQTVRPTQRLAIAGLEEIGDGISSVAQKAQHLLSVLDIPALKRAKKNIQGWIDQQRDQTSSDLGKAALALGAVTSEVLLPEGVLDVVPASKLGKAIKAAESAKRAYADAVKFSDVAKIAARVEVKNGYKYSIDEFGRVTHVEGALGLNTAQGRNLVAQKNAGGPDRLRTDDGGHFIARIFDGPVDDFNHFAQDRNFNRGPYKAIENSWRRDIDAGKSVHVSIRPSYQGESKRPDILEIITTVDGRQTLQILKNMSYRVVEQ